MERYEFDAVLKASSVGSGGAYVEFPYDVEKAFGVKGRVKVKCLFDGVEYRGSLVKMGTDCHIVGVTKDIREAAGKKIGDTIRVSLERDADERTVDVHPLLRKELDADASLDAAYGKLSFTRKKEISAFLTSAKKEGTLLARLKKIISDLNAPSP